MPLTRYRESIFPFHIRVRRAGIEKVETTEDVSGDEVEFCIGEIDADASSRAFRKWHEFVLQSLLIIGCNFEPALGPERLGIHEGLWVVMVDISAGRNGGLKIRAPDQRESRHKLGKNTYSGWNLMSAEKGA